MAENNAKPDGKAEAGRLEAMAQEREKLYELAEKLNGERRPGSPRLVVMGKMLGDGVHFI